MNEIRVRPTKYSHRVIAFIDVLGFGALVDSTSNSPPKSQAKTLKRISDAILWALEELDEFHTPLSDVVFTQFSDSFVLSCDAGQNSFALHDFTIAALSIIDCFLGSQLLLRGGITQGDLIHDDKLLFGPAMNRAYHLESKMARVPRIIMDPDLPQLQDFSAFKNLLARDDDQLLFVNYFHAWKRWFVVPGYRLSLQKAIEAMPQSEKLQEKRTWMARRYNELLDSFSFEDFERHMLEYVQDTDANNAVVEDQLNILNDARQLCKLKI